MPSVNGKNGTEDVATPLIVIASNRGPFSFTQTKDGNFDSKRGVGGLVTALAAVAEKHDVLWVASALSKGDREWAEKHPQQPENVQGIYLRLITPSKTHYDRYYNIIANPLLWFIHHELWDTPRDPQITQETWQAWESYVAINKRFAQAIAASIDKETRPVLVFPQDYQLHLVPRFLRELVSAQVHIQPFIHIPWPGPDAWRLLPEKMRIEILTDLLASDRIGFQTEKDAFNFVQTCRFYIRDAHSRGRRDAIFYQDRVIEARPYPISIDVENVETIAQETQTQLFKSHLLQTIGGRKLILRVDRVEPSKNILRGFQAYRALLEKYPQHRGKVQMLALLVPSRMEVDQYQTYLKDIMAEAGLINAEFADGLWEPTRIILGNNYPRAIAAMQLYDVLLVNPIADGMNLVAKEGALVNERNGVLLLSEFAGAFFELGNHALTITPFDIHSTAEALHQALEMPPAEKEMRATALREKIRKADVKHWFQSQIEDALASKSHVNTASTSSVPERNASA